MAAGLKALAGKRLDLPLHWFMNPLRIKMAKVVRPPTATTRRKERVITVPMPVEGFFNMMAPFGQGTVKGLLWNEEGTALEPTRTTSQAFFEYKYLLDAPSQLNTFWEMENWDRPRTKGSWRRGRGAARLHLSHAAGERGSKTLLLAMVCGNVSIRLRQPRKERDIPTLRLIFKVLSMDEQAKILWPTTFGSRTKAALRKMATSSLEAMIRDKLYPTTTRTEQTLLQVGSDAIWDPAPAGRMLLPEE